MTTGRRSGGDSHTRVPRYMLTCHFDQRMTWQWRMMLTWQRQSRAGLPGTADRHHVIISPAFGGGAPFGREKVSTSYNEIEVMYS
eukprot:1190953-Prorocentrum_minimum.AAC.1